MDFEIDRRELLKATGAGMATVTVTTGAASAQTNLNDLPGDGSETTPYELGSFEDLLAIDQDLTANYVLTDNIEFGGEGTISPLAFGSSYDAGFTGSLDGQGFEVRDFEIDGGPTYEGGGLFGIIGSGGVVENLNIVNITVTGGAPVGGLTGIFDGGADGEISNVSVSGTVESSGSSGTGGLVGQMDSGSISDSDSSATVRGENGNLGGAVGSMGFFGGSGGEIARTYAEGDVEPATESTPFSVGSFVGGMVSGSINLCFATGNATGGDDVGGFVGGVRGGSITKAYARGDVTGIGSEAGPLGGFAGEVSNSSGPVSVEEVYSTGAVTDGFGGGLVGRFENIEELEIGTVTPFDFHVTNGYWDVPASGLDSSDGGTGLGNLSDPAPVDEMTGDDAPNNMAGFDFDNTWVTVTGDENPIIGFSPAETQTTIQATQPTGPGYPVFGWQLEGEAGKTCIDRRNLSRGQEDEECPVDRDIGRGGSRRELDRESGRGGDDTHRDSSTARRDRGRGDRRGR